jgi:hypothetical protein
MPVARLVLKVLYMHARRLRRGRVDPARAGQHADNNDYAQVVKHIDCWDKVQVCEWDCALTSGSATSKHIAAHAANNVGSFISHSSLARIVNWQG